MKAKKRPFYIIITFLTIILFGGCGGDYYPKPRGYVRVDFPDSIAYASLSDLRKSENATSLPYNFRVSSLAVVKPFVNKHDPQLDWINIYYPFFDATIHISYLPVENNINLILEDSYKFVSEHKRKASNVEESLFTDGEVGGILYDISGNVASTVQFLLTDTTKNFLRGALYFNVLTNADSLAPMIRFLKRDIDTIINTLTFSTLSKDRKSTN